MGLYCYCTQLTLFVKAYRMRSTHHACSQWWHCCNALESLSYILPTCALIPHKFKTIISLGVVVGCVVRRFPWGISYPIASATLIVCRQTHIRHHDLMHLLQYIDHFKLNGIALHCVSL